ncbi:hypothetical protein Hypma_008210 [Hypsizygus marmoreus]|uniref:Uncharacterized protein n=1 Tax=Hypsizygus marmoreus TaxID=39966 RepID=A0A369JS18_HYPMA|nr:hypothetical protein Hypma_008210 [Hypsizygus marmoreus]
MRLRNWKETVEPTIQDTLCDVHPHTLEEGFHWFAPPGTPVWVFAGEGRNKKWRQGKVWCEHDQVLHPRGIFRTYEVSYHYKKKKVFQLFTPGLQWEMKPDTPEVRELLREAGVFC